MTNTPDTTTTRGDAGTDCPAPLPSYEERISAQELVVVSPEARRTRWTLNGPLETAITIARDYKFDPDEVPEPYYHGPSSDDRKSTWHPFSQSSISEPKVSSLKLYVNPLDDWDYYWMENHEGHTEHDGIYEPAEVLYGPFPDDDDDEKSDGDEHLLLCCGTKRPRGKKTNVVVKATGDFVTIHDFLSVVHPYLMARRDEILVAMHEDPGRMNGPFPPETKLMMNWQSPNGVDVSDEAEWLRRHKRKPKRSLAI